MVDWTRRDILKLGLSSLALSHVSCGARPRRPVAAAPPPRYYVLVLLSGGIDPIDTTDPKVRADVEPGIDVPYGANEIVDAGGFPLGPHFAPLARWSHRMAILNGVQTTVANHETGSTQFARLRTKSKYFTPSALEVIARYRDGQPLGCVSMGPTPFWDYSAGWFGTPEKVIAARAANDPKERNLLDEIDATEVADLERLAAVYRRHAGRLREGGGAPERLTTAQNLEESAALFERLPAVPRFQLEQWSPVPGRQNIARNLQRTLWLFENDLASCVYLRVGFLEWDSHYNNVERQTEWNQNIASQLDRFLGELERRQNAHGALMSNTLVMVSSEIGRFPRINPHQGKDHFPEIPFFFFGRGVQTGQAFGQTGRQMQALPISLRTGRRAEVGGDPVILDDVGTTLLHVAGVDPAVHGYAGQRLRFLEAA